MTRYTLLLLILCATSALSDDAPKATTVTFTDHVLPILQKNCLACHNESEYEGELIMESRDLVMAGGDSGPAIIAGNAEDSLLYQLAKYDTDPVMPPEDNDVGAKQLSSDELSILKSWIDQGANDAKSGPVTKSINWQPIPDEYASVLALEISPDGRWLATGRGNQLVVYSVVENKLKQILIDESINATHPDSAHLDSVQSVTWNADQTLIASGGYRVVKIWQRTPVDEDGTKFQRDVTTNDGARQIKLVPDGEQTVAKLIQLSDKKELATINPNVIATERISREEFRHGLLDERLTLYKSDVESAKKRKANAENDVKKADEEIKKATEELPKKEEALANTKEALDKLAEEVKANETKRTETEARIKQLMAEIKPAEDEAKAKLNESLKKSQAELKQTQEAIKNKTKERNESKKKHDKAQTDLDDAKKAVERSKLAKSRLEKSVVDRQTEIESAEATLNQHQTIFDDSAAKLATRKQLPFADWKQIVLPKDNENHFFLVNAVGQTARIATKDGMLLETTDEMLGDWKLIKTIGDPNGDSPFADRITSLAFRPDGKLLAVGGGEPSRSGELRLWNTSDWTQQSIVEDIHSDVVYDLQFAPLGPELVSCGSDRMMKLIDSDTGKHIRTFEGHTGHVLGVSWRADGRTLATAGADQVVKVWDAKEGGQKKTISGFKEEITAVRYLGLENRMVFSTGKGYVHSRDSEGNGKTGFGQTTDYVHRVSCSRDGKTVAAAGTKRTVRVWDAQGKLLAEFK